MKFISIESLIFTVSFLLVVVIISNNTAPGVLQQGIVVLLVSLIIGSRFLFSPSTHLNPQVLKRILLFLTCVFVQLLVIATGGFYSPFLIILYLFTLGSSFLLNFQSSIFFLLYSVVILIFNTWVNPNLSQIFSDDPWSVILYLASFAVTIPLTQLLTRSYHVKDAISRILSEHLHVVESREKTILSGLNEIVIVTDTNLGILSANDAAIIAMHVSIPEIIGRSFLQVVPLIDENGNHPAKETLELHRVLTDKITHIVNGFSFNRKGLSKNENVSIQIRPVGDLTGAIKQIVFVISNTKSPQEQIKDQIHPEQAKIRYLALAESFKKLPFMNRFPQILKQFELLEKVRDDLLTAIEIENTEEKTPITVDDIAQLTKQAVDAKQSFAKHFSVALNFVLPNDEITELGLLRLTESKMNLEVIPLSEFAAPINRKWFVLLMRKLIDVAILLAPEKNAGVHVFVNREGTKEVKVGISTPAENITQEKVNELFKEYYGNISRYARLSFGSGLEGVLAKRIADRLHIPLTVNVFDNPPFLIFLIKFTKEPA